MEQQNARWTEKTAAAEESYQQGDVERLSAVLDGMYASLLHHGDRPATARAINRLAKALAEIRNGRLDEAWGHYEKASKDF